MSDKSERSAVASAGAREILTILRDGRARTRGRLAEMAGIARSTVGIRVDELIELGLVREEEDPIYTGGRPSSRVLLEPMARVVMAVDIGATHAAYALTDLLGRSLASGRKPLEGGDEPQAVLGWLADETTRTLGDLGIDPGRLGAIGVGLAAPVEQATGRPVRPPVMPRWDAFDSAAWLHRSFDIPVVVEKDVNMMAIGDRASRTAPPANTMFIKVASGIGAGIVVDGRLYRGTQGMAGDIGHVPVSGYDTPCRCGGSGCLEAVASGPALAASLRAKGVDAATSADVIQLVSEGDLDAIQAVRRAGRDLGEVLATCVSLFNPALIVLGGAIAAAGESLLAGVRETVYARSMPLATKDLSIMLSGAEINAGIRGAAELAADKAIGTWVGID